MSVINSGLGWKCNSNYFVDEADAELAIVSTDTAIKALQGAAITAQITNGNSTQLFLISTVENNAKLKMNSSLRTVYSVSVGGETWYISMSYMSDSVTSDYPLITASKGESLNDTTPENLAKIITEITEAAEVVFAKKVPTVDYIHQYVEGVVSGDNAKIANVYSTKTELNAVNGNVGILSNLTTTDKSNTVSAINEVNTRCDNIIDMIEDKTVIYGFHVNPSESDPFDAVTYLADAVGMTPAAMGETTFNSGSWGKAFFMPKPCMQKYDGTVDYYLDPNDYSKKADGTVSDISDYSYGGNAMMQFPKLWFKFESGAAEGEGYFYVSNKQVDDSYHCWCNYDSDGNQIDHFYMAIYNGVTYDGKMRSLSGKKLSSWNTTAYSSSATYAVDDVVNYDGKMYKCITAVETAETFDPNKWAQFGFNGNTTGQEEIDAAVANDTTAKSEWYTDVWCDRVVITALLYLMGKSLALQGTYGRGIDTGSQSAAQSYVTGAADDKGLFYGNTSSGNSVVKAFGIENFWACKWHRTAGLMGLSNGKTAYKMTYSSADGSTATAYNSDGTGYLINNTVRPSAGYISKMGFGNWGIVPIITTGGSSSTYYCDYLYGSNSILSFAIVGGASNSSLNCGFSFALGSKFTNRDWDIASALSCKPLKGV